MLHGELGKFHTSLCVVCMDSVVSESSGCVTLLAEDKRRRDCAITAAAVNKHDEAS